jgi:protein ImuB
MASSGSPVKNGRRILALWFPRLSTDRLQRQWKAREAAEFFPPATDAATAPPLVVAAKTDNAFKLTAVDRKATSLGLSAGMPLADARAKLPALKVMMANEPADLKLLEHIADWCGRFTPFVALDPPRALFLDVTGATHLFGGEEVLLDDIRKRLFRQGFAVHGALAGTAASARALACYRDGAVIASGEDAAAVAPLPIEALRLAANTTHAFRRAGLKTVGQVATRKRPELTARFGADMVAVLDAALGHGENLICPRCPLPDYSLEHRFAEPIVTEHAVLQTLCALTKTLAGTLAGRGEGARRMEGVFFRADGAVRRLAVETGEPTRNSAIIERLFREKLNALSDPLDPGFGYDLIRLEASRLERSQAQALYFDSNVHEEKALRFLIDRLAARFGSHHVLSFQPNDTHIPEAAWVAVPAQYAPPPRRSWVKIREPREAPRRPLRMFAKPESVDVVAEIPEGPPVKFRWRRVSHNVVHAEGPERIAMEWWRQQRPQPTRDYYCVEDEAGRRFWLYRDGLYARETATPPWYVHGVFA